MVETTVSATAVRRLAVAAQGYASRYRRATDSSVEAAIRRLSCVQLDSISTVERSHRIALTSRIGNFPRETVSNLLSQGRIFEFWAHEACLLPIESWPLFRRAMQNGGRDWYSNVNDVKNAYPELAAEILTRIREDGPLASRQFEGAAGGGMWNWKPAKAMLERLWNHGELVIAGRQGFQRVYDLTERVIPRAQLDAPVPPAAEVLRALAEQAVRARGALTEAGITEHWRLRGGTARVKSAVGELVAEDRLRRLRVDDAGSDVLVSADAELDRPAPGVAVLLSPFDNLLWDRPFARRILGFDHLIEVYKPAPQRQYGYYVLPFLRGDRIVGRADLKSERNEGRLVVRAFHREDGVRASGALDDALDKALGRLARSIGLEEVRQVNVSVEEARRIAVRAQLLDGSATDVLSTIRRLGLLQIDVVQPVERPQHLVLFSRLGPGYDRAELDRLLWEERSLFEWDAFIYPLEDLPLVRARIRNFRRSRETKNQRWVHDFLTTNRAFRRYVMKELEQRGPLLSRELEDRSVGVRRDSRWWGPRMVGLMLLSLHLYGEIVVAGRQGSERLWDLTSRWWPETKTISVRDGERIRAERRFRTQGVRLVRGEWQAHPDTADGPVPDRAVLLSPFDRLVSDRNRAEALWNFRYRLEMFVPKAKREYGYYVLPLLVGDEVVGRAEPRFDRKTGTLELLGAWGDTSRLDEALADLEAWLGARAA